jgi:hypothetical protein
MTGIVDKFSVLEPVGNKLDTLLMEANSKACSDCKDKLWGEHKSCCVHCARFRGYLGTNNYHGNWADIDKLIRAFKRKFGWDKATGFLKDRRCVLPRYLRSKVCLNYGLYNQSSGLYCRQFSIALGKSKVKEAKTILKKLFLARETIAFLVGWICFCPCLFGM